MNQANGLFFTVLVDLVTLAVQYAKKYSTLMLSQLISTTINLPFAKEVGADIVINGLEVEDVPGLIKEKTDGGAHQLS